MITGATTAQLQLTTARVAAFGLAFLTTAALWWLYFNLVAATAERQRAKAKDRTLLARDAYTYLHVVIVGGILLTAVGDELVIAHPTEELPHAELVAVACGPALYLLAHVALRLRMTGTVSVSRLAGALACLAIGAVGTFAPALVVAGLLFGVLVAVIVRDQIAAARHQTRDEPSRPRDSRPRDSADKDSPRSPHRWMLPTATPNAQFSGRRPISGYRELSAAMPARAGTRAGRAPSH